MVFPKIETNKTDALGLEVRLVAKMPFGSKCSYSSCTRVSLWTRTGLDAGGNEDTRVERGYIQIYYALSIFVELGIALFVF